MVLQGREYDVRIYYDKRVRLSSYRLQHANVRIDRFNTTLERYLLIVIQVRPQPVPELIWLTNESQVKKPNSSQIPKVVMEGDRVSPPITKRHTMRTKPAVSSRGESVH
jgi:hypothetical protein